MTLAIVGLSLLFIVIGIVFGIKAYRLLHARVDPTAEQQPFRQDTHIADTIWELGHRAEASARRKFLERTALGLLGAIVARSAALGDTLPAATEFLTKNGRSSVPGRSSQNMRVAASHIDVTEPDGPHVDIPGTPAPHQDNPTPYQDNPTPYQDHPTPYQDNPPTPYQDNPAPPHTDTPHTDTAR